MKGCENSQVVVIKLGGSVLVDEDSYRQAARFLVRRLHKCSAERLLVVVSARKGVTDELERSAREVVNDPSRRTLDLLWATGEMRSVARLTLHLEGMGVAAVGLNVHETGLRFDGTHSGESSITSLSVELRRAFDDASVVVVPGFFAILTGGTVVSLGRGGSDLTAVLLAEELEARQCELIKDVAGYHTKDPRVHEQTKHLEFLSYEQALNMASEGCELVQAQALEAARLAGLRLIVRSLDDRARGSVVSRYGNKTNPVPPCSQRKED
jgi:aspartate kinase